jgi:hypothetical protein
MKFAVVAFLLLAFLNGAFSSYNETFVKYFVWPMAASAYSDHPELCVKDNFNSSDFKRRVEVECDILPIDNCVAFTAVSHSEKAIIISYRGSLVTEVLMEVIDALSEKPVIAFNGNAKVLEYFLNAFNDLWFAGIKDDFLTLKNANPGYELWVTGHSLGAAMASIAATTIATTKLFDADKIKLVTFGQPRVGDHSYATLVDSTIAYSYRIIHQNDIVPTVPPSWLFNYYHHKSEVWYNNNMADGKTFKECDDDENRHCSEGAIDLNILDHLFYFNVPANFPFAGCKDWNKYKNA